jgi:predicted nucleic acid-binding protein
VDAFDADVIIYAADPTHPLGARVRQLFVAGEHEPVGIGSVMLLPEVLSKPVREERFAQVRELSQLLGRLELRPLDLETARVSTALAALHGLRAADAVHLATAVVSGADRFVTNNRRDFPKTIGDIAITYPDDL